MWGLSHRIEMCLIYVLYKHWSECSHPYGTSWLITLRSTGIICIRLIRPRPMPKGPNATLSLTCIITFYLNQDTNNIEKGKISQCNSRVVAEPAIPFHPSRYSRIPCHRQILLLRIYNVHQNDASAMARYGRLTYARDGRRTGWPSVVIETH